MRKLLLYTLFFTGIIINAQQRKLKGEVTYITSDNVYVKFSNTEGISIGDTLYIESGSKYLPAIIVEYRASNSISGKSISNLELKKGEKIFAFIKENKTVDKKTVENEEQKTAVPIQTAAGLSKLSGEKIEAPALYGRFSVTSYSNLANVGGWGSQRWRYRLSLDGDNLFDSNIGIESYITFSYRTDRTDLIKENINNALKIYNLSANFKPTKNLTFSVGRRINRSVTNLGAYDGIDLKYNFGIFETGIIIGSRPNWTDYSVNFNYFQYGAFINKTDNFGKKYMQSSVGFLEQKNHSKTDRRFLYFQHSNNLIRNTRIFISSEVDLFKKINNSPKSDFRFTSIYASVRYSPSRLWSVTGSYDTRKNVVYFETFQNYSDSLLEASSRQGLRLRFNVRPFSRLSFGIGGGYRNRKSDPQPTYNGNIFASYSGLPLIGGTGSVSVNILSTSYVAGTVAGLRIYEDLFPGLLNINLGYRNVFYQYSITESSLIQNIIDAGLDLRIQRDITLSINYEGIFEGPRTQGLIFANINTRF